MNNNNNNNNNSNNKSDSGFGLRDSVKMFYVEITPTKYYFSGPGIEKSNRVLRKYKEHPCNFIRISFVDEDGTRLHNLNTTLLTHFKTILESGVTVAGQ